MPFICGVHDHNMIFHVECLTHDQNTIQNFFIWFVYYLLFFNTWPYFLYRYDYKDVSLAMQILTFKKHFFFFLFFFCMVSLQHSVFIDDLLIEEHYWFLSFIGWLLLLWKFSCTSEIKYVCIYIYVFSVKKIILIKFMMTHALITDKSHIFVMSVVSFLRGLVAYPYNTYS